MKPIALISLLAASIATPAILTPAASADAAPIYTGLFSNTAVQGHDVVAYFTEGRPVEGSRAFTTEYQGAEFRFVSQQNLDTFLAEPEAYAPQYGGYCAWAVAQGQRAKGDARHWAIVDGKLYLNFNEDIQSDWNADRENFITQADENWPTVLN